VGWLTFSGDEPEQPANTVAIRQTLHSLVSFMLSQLSLCVKIPAILQAH
jgi:hypothetical protein